MMSVVRLTSQALVLGLSLLVPVGALAQDEGEAVPTLDLEPERGCPARPDLVPFTSRSVVGLPGAGWVVHQAVIPDKKDTFFPGVEAERPGVKLVPSEVDVRKLGAPDPSVPLWVFGKADAAPCRAVPTTWWAVRMGTDEERKTYLMAELQMECDVLPPGRLSGTPVAVRQKDAPTGCKLRRANDNSTGKAGMGLPLELVDFVPVRECEAPECVRLWERFSSQWTDGSAVHDLTVSWMERKGKKDPCDWATEDLTLLLLRPPGALAPAPLKGGGSYFGTLYDASGPRTVLSRHLGVLYAHDVAKPNAAPKAIRYASPTEEDLLTAKRTLSPCKKR
ncbi:hypothetical protein [Myxococcus sp. RHSTA-1-4]|uniref:hypothetical protein n=1 Tax=Myxococcus sp. RHSTA-1-4 TaxID=2874601 RepID=UPI001CC11A32|nr:hypothetical protein [Myxococcus sp. RHSTA-1-4]MBZ4415009.1 hypothetical protein [Myxococcus sp. RHSTA-1-4]